MATIQGAAGNVAKVDMAGNLNVVLPSSKADAGAIRLYSDNDSGSVTGTPQLISPQTSKDFRLRVGLDSILFNESFNATAQNTGVWKHQSSTMTATQSGGFLNINAAGTSTAANNYAYLQTWRVFNYIPESPLVVETKAQITAIPIANEVVSFGLGFPLVAVECIDGAWFELTSAGLVGCLRYNSGPKVTTSVLKDAASFSLNTTYKFHMHVSKAGVEFWLDDILLGVLGTPAAQSQPYVSVSLPYFVQKYNPALVGSSPNLILKVGEVSIIQTDLAFGKLFQQQMSGAGLHGYQGQNGGTMGPLATYPNSTNPTTAAPSNTALTANLPAGLGGQGLATLWNLAATDMVLMSWQNPAGSVAITPRTLYIYGLTISCAAFSAAWTAPAAGQHLFQFGLAFGHTAVSLATTETASFASGTTKAPRKKVLGLIGFATGATPIGTPGDKVIQVKFDCPVAVNPGEFVQVICKMLNGAATATGGLYFTVDFDAHFE